MKDKLVKIAAKAVEVVKEHPVKVAIIGVCVIGGAFALNRFIGHGSSEAEEFVETIVESVES